MASPTRNFLHSAAMAFFGIAISSPSIAASGPSPGIYPDKIVLGQSAKLSGSGGTQAGLQYRDGMRLAFDAVNAAGGVNGRRIELISLDDANKGDLAAANTRELINTHRVFALIGYTFITPVKAALATLPTIQASDIPFIAPYTGFPELYDGTYRNVFMFRASYFDEMATLAKHIDTVSFKDVALIHYNTASGEEFKKDMTLQLKAFGRKLIASASMQINPPDPMQAVQTAIPELTVNCPNVIILGVSGKDAAATVRAVKSRGCQSTQYLARGLVDVSVLQRELGEEARGIMVSQLVPNPFRTNTHPLIQEYKQRLQARNPPSNPDFIELEGFIVGKFLVQAFKRVGTNLDRKSFTQAMEAERLDGPGHYRVQFAGGKRVGTRYVNFVLLSNDGRIVD